jgi:hypothetical protein
MYRQVDPVVINGFASTVPVQIPETIATVRTIMICFIRIDVIFTVASCSSYLKKV